MSPGLQTFVSISRTFISRQPAPYSDCIANLVPFSDYSRKIFNYFDQFEVEEYDQELCIKFCYQDKLIEKCSCADLSTMTTLNDCRYCGSNSDDYCISQLLATFLSTSPDVFCENVCRPKCEAQRFDYFISQSKYPSQDFLDLHPTFSNNTLTVVVNYKDNTYTQIRESPAETFEKLLGDVGGQINLFVGLSFLTVLEIFELGFHIMLLVYRAKFKKNNEISNT